MELKVLISVDAEIDLHCGSVFFSVGMLVDDGLADGVGFST